MKRAYIFWSIVIFVLFSSVYLYMQTSSIFGGDAGDLVTAAYAGGVAHPPGYPLYTFLGYILSHTLDTGTVSWRVGLLSSIPLAGALGILFLYLAYTTRSIIASLVAVLTLGTSYIYWLYAIVPEVFGLHILFVALQLLTLEGWRRSHARWLGIAFIALFVLSLSHHHIILFMVPAYVYQLSKERKHVKTFVQKNSLIIIPTIIICFLPIMWIVIAIQNLAAYTWEDTLTLNSVVRILTRATYGSFASATIIVQEPLARLTGVYAYFAFVIEDITIPAAFLSVVGAIYQLLKRRTMFLFHFIAFMLTGPLYFFYAGYILTNSFTIATFERFVMPSYVFIIIWLAYGVLALIHGISRVVQRIRFQTNTTSSLNYVPMIFALCLIIPLNLLFINYPKMIILKNDTTAENLAMNILNSAEKNAILLISRDNEIFNASYLNIAMGYRPDLVVINRSHLLDSRRFKNIKHHHPDIFFPKRTAQTFSDEFIVENAKKRQLYTNDTFALPEEYVWIREGVLFKLYLKKDLPPYQNILDINNKLWNSYFDPYDGSLGQYKHLMLASNLHLYRIHRYETGDYFLAAKDYAGAEKHYAAALSYDDADVKVYLRLAVVLIEQKKCEEAEKLLTNTFNRFPTSQDTPLLFIKLYTECDENNDKVTEWKDTYDTLMKKTQQKLE